MTRLFAVLMLFATTAWASNRQMLFARYSATDASDTGFSATTNDRLYCGRFPATSTITATKLISEVTANASTTAGFAIYADADAGAQLGEAFAAVTNDGGNGTVISASGLSMSFTIGTLYRVCTCVATVANAFPITSAHKSTSSTTRFAQMLNQGGTFLGHAANPCVTGDPPATTGALTADDVAPVPLVLVEE